MEKGENKMKTTPQIIKEITENEMVNTLNQLQHILNDLINGKKYDGNKLDQDKLIHYKLCLIKMMDEKLAKNNMYQNRKRTIYGS